MNRGRKKKKNEWVEEPVRPVDPTSPSGERTWNSANGNLFWNREWVRGVRMVMLVCVSSFYRPKYPCTLFLLPFLPPPYYR